MPAVCDSPGYIAKTCPWRYTKCTKPGCIGIRMVVQSDLALTKGKVCLKCHFPDCDGFIWLDVAKKKATETCELCPTKGHMRTKCIWSNLPCPNEQCLGTRPVRVSKTEDHPEQRYLKCNVCGKFDWLMDYMASHEAGKVCDKIMKSSPTSQNKKYDAMNEICNAFTTKIKVKAKNTCYNYNDNDHFANSCPWKAINCIEGCNNTMKLGKSCQHDTMNETFLKYEVCGFFAMLQELQN